MKERELTNEVISASTQREAVLGAIEEAVKTSYATATKRGVFGAPSPAKIIPRFKTEFERNLAVNLEQDISEISKVVWSDDTSANAAVNNTTQELMIGRRMADNITQWVEYCVEHGITDPDKIVQQSYKAIDYMAEILIHEIVHLIQQERQPGTNKDYRSYLAKDKNRFYDAMTNMASPEDWEIYLASPQEIPAHAHQLVYRLISQAQQGKSLKSLPADEIPYVIQELKDTLRDVASGMSESGDTLKRYMRFNTTDPQKMKVFKRFMKSVYQEVQNYITMLQQRQQQPVTESFDKPYDYEQTLQNSISSHYEFTTDDGRAVLVKIQSYGSSRRAGWRIDFETDGGINLTGKGDGLKIIGTVVAIVTEWMSGPQAAAAKEINFAANTREPSRVKLYDRLAKMMPRFGFELADASNYRSLGTTYKSYTFKRPKQEVTETFDKPYEFEKVSAFGSVIYRWTLDDGREAGCMIKLEDSDENNWGLMFSVNGEIRQTGTGDAQRIFATVIACFRDWLATEGKDANGIAFAGSLNEPSRIKLYDRFAKLMPRFGFRDLKSNFQTSNSKFYEFERIKPLNETFDRPLPWHKRMKSWGLEYTFTTPKGKSGEMAVGINRSGVADIIFSIDGSMEQTGRGEEIPIFATVIDCAKNALGDPYMDRAWKIEYGADKSDESRKKLYSRLGRMLQQAGYQFVGTHDTNLYTVFEYVHPEKQKEHEPRKPELIPPEEQIEETFNSTVDYHWRELSPRIGEAVFKVGKVPYQFTFQRLTSAEVITVAFGLLNPKGKQSPYGVTGTGNQQQVFGTVVAIMRDILDKFPTTAKIVFSAAEENRQKLYARMAKTLLPDWIVQQNADIFKLINPECDYGQYLKDQGLAESAGATCSGSIATVAQPLGVVVRRSGSRILSGISTAEPFPNTPDWMKTHQKSSRNKKRSK